MPEIKCPACGQLNPPDAVKCSNCGSALQQAIQPGEAPTKKTTAELEPILPQWLRDAREKARKSSEQDENLPQGTQPAAAESDLLAGLRAQSSGDQEDQIPDWLAGITGGREKTPPPAVSGPQRIELGEPEEFESEEEQPAPLLGESELAPWLAALTPPKEESTGTDALQDWLRQATSSEEETPTLPPEPRTRPLAYESGEEVASWLDALRGEDAKTVPIAGDARAAHEPEQEPPTPPPAPESFEVPDWLKRLQTDMPAVESSAEASAPEKPAVTESPSEGQATPAAAIESEPPLAEAELPDWLKGLKAESPSSELPMEESGMWAAPESEEGPTAQPPVSEPEAITPAALDVELPDWLMNLDQPPAESAEPPARLPDWMEPSGPEQAPAEESPGLPAAPVETPGWVADLGPVAERPPSDQPFLPSGEAEEAGLKEEQEPMPSGLDSLFTEVPDWLAETREAAPASGLEPAAGSEETDFLTPANLPSWVQAMRPMEPGVQPGEGEAGDETLETSGPLAGLRGVLPALAPAMPSGRPQPHSTRLQASEEQLTHSELLEQVLLAETRPEPMSVPPRSAVWRSVRIGIGLSLFALLLLSVFAGTSLLPLPAGRPSETMAALEAVESVATNAPVLLVFDYEPALAGEMEAAAAPLLDHMIVMKAPRMTLLSTSPTGTALAGRLFAGPLGQLAVDPSSYINLGYLPGGLSGVRAFAQNPPAAMPLSADSVPAWDEPAAQGIRNINDYEAVLLLTDNASAGRTWIEQLLPLYTRGSLVVVSSAQAGPMLQPYYQSGQIKGLVTGVFDAAILEQNNAGRPGLARRYWDAFNVGLLAGLLILVLGGLWNLAAGLRVRRSGEAG